MVDWRRLRCSAEADAFSVASLFAAASLFLRDRGPSGVLHLQAAAAASLISPSRRLRADAHCGKHAGVGGTGTSSSSNLLCHSILFLNRSIPSSRNRFWLVV
uniref:Uncharacterized protein n=1 Tax=Arundo donax TaxID=35708 RepID=A0A0A9D9T4_ARUDO